MEYHATQGDEVEDLLSLLAFAKEQLPEIEAVSSGAIASDYQRLRVEHVHFHTSPFISILFCLLYAKLSYWQMPTLVQALYYIFSSS